MLFGANIGLFFGVVLPPIIYALIIYLTSPHKSINLNRGLYFVAGGMFSVLLLPFIQVLFPGWGHLVFDPFQLHFFAVAPREELIKYMSFFFLTRSIKLNNVHPVSVMFYYGMIGLGFAMVENLQYLANYGKEVLLIRTFTSTIAHMLFGMFTGYWIAMGKINSGKFGNRSVFGLLMSKYGEMKKLIYSGIGILSAIIYHGLWNYSLSSSGQAAYSIMILMLVMGLVVAKFASDDLTTKYRRKLRNV
jgi:RsiW-degrading membrane proteinase PrsW (M82 family)